MILLACAVEAELRFWEPRDDVVTLVMGVGPVEASCALTAALCERRYRLVVNAGLAGAFDGTARVGDAVIVAEDMMELGLESGAPLRLPSGERTFDTARSDASLVARLGGKEFLTVRGVTVSRVTSTEQTARRLAAKLGAQVESMEGFAALRAAERMGVPAIELRGISNRCGERASSGWNFDAGIAGLARITRSLVELA
ncbi:MAG: futalosine hydrolase [Candidatus Cybelea sp.]